MIGSKTMTGGRGKVAGVKAKTKMTTGRLQKVAKTKVTTGRLQKVARPKARRGNRHGMHKAKVGTKIVGAKAHTKMHGRRTRSKTGLTRRQREVINILIRGSNGIMITSSGTISNEPHGWCRSVTMVITPVMHYAVRTKSCTSLGCIRMPFRFLVCSYLSLAWLSMSCLKQACDRRL